jgi:type I restriction enzyme S subunit
LRVNVGVNPEFAFQFLNVWDSSKAIYGYGSGLRQNLDFSDFKRMPIAVPPPAEQAAIVRFLDWAGGRLERTIRAKRKIIALLNEQKQAIIHRAVTRGLDPNVPLKDSGIPWLGEIPAHWEVRRAKYVFREVDVRSESGNETHLAMSQKLGLVPSNMVQSTLRSDSYAGAKLCEVGDLILNRLKAHLGVFASASIRGVISPDYSVFRRLIPANITFFETVLKSTACRGELRIRAKGIVEGFWRLYTDNFYDIVLPVPPLLEQDEIMNSISAKTHNQNTAISRLEREIELLREYRTRLISDVVTGKLDVRAAAASLPAEPGSDSLATDLDALEDDTVDVLDATEEDV